MSMKSDTLLSAWGAFFVAHALSIQKIEKALAGNAPLSLSEYDLLLTIERSPEKRLRYTDLSSESVYTKSGVTRVMKRLESRGFIDREKCESDGRGAFARLNKKGARALQETWTLYSEEILKIFDPAMTQSEARELERLSAKIIDQVHAAPLIRIGSKNHSDSQK